MFIAGTGSQRAGGKRKHSLMRALSRAGLKGLRCSDEGKHLFSNGSEKNEGPWEAKRQMKKRVSQDITRGKRKINESECIADFWVLKGAAPVFSVWKHFGCGCRPLG